MDLTSIQMTMVRDNGYEAPVGAGGADDDGADLIAGSHIVSGQSVKNELQAKSLPTRRMPHDQN